VGSAVFRSDHTAGPKTAGRDAALFITKLPKAEHDADEWQAAMQALLSVAEHDGPTMFAGIGVMRAQQRHETKAASAPRRKRTKAYRQGLQARLTGKACRQGLQDCAMKLIHT
jgi:hypothetical protein